ncbi:hypothetical protein CHH28_15285 [Bacterioplanes sanyensis]|uniref:Uncharacterized protein n=1 Tax=Bacterioplanes sanyensis TaxID=1249553 RepID=A0A222FMF1_9GAMM|nr:ABC transporter substrate-binding protein [Bacterioplanes sanyensis]ASP39950.1 hypothetical protein CHH28_15285 [Bacterioplanes sanyensis]
MRLKNIAMVAMMLLSSGGACADAHIPSSMTFAAADWCPYSCSDGSGIVSDYLRELFAQRNITLDIQVIPWSRALQEVRFGHIDGLLTLVPGEADGVLMPASPTMSYQDCFFKRPGSDWTYTDMAALQHSVLGVVQGYGYSPEIDAYIAGAKPGSVHAIAGAEPSERLIAMLQRERIDLYLDDVRVTQHTLKRLEMMPGAITVAGCLPEKPLYLGLSAQPEWSAELIKWLDDALAEADNQHRWREISEQY